MIDARPRLPRSVSSRTPAVALALASAQALLPASAFAQAPQTEVAVLSAMSASVKR